MGSITISKLQTSDMVVAWLDADSIARAVSPKLENGKIRAAVRIMFSNDRELNIYRSVLSAENGKASGIIMGLKLFIFTLL